MTAGFRWAALKTVMELRAGDRAGLRGPWRQQWCEHSMPVAARLPLQP